MIYPDFETFSRRAGEGNLIPVCREILADTETPVTALLKLADRPHLFLLESVEGGEKWARYSFLGADPQMIVRIREGEVIVEEKGSQRRVAHGGDPMKVLKEILGRCRPVPMEGLPRFFGGAVGFLGYEMVRYFERIPEGNGPAPAEDEAVFLVTDTLIIFDNVRHTIKVVACAMTAEGPDLRAVYDDAVGRIDAMTALIRVRWDVRPPRFRRPSGPSSRTWPRRPSGRWSGGPRTTSPRGTSSRPSSPSGSSGRPRRTRSIFTGPCAT